MEGTAEEREGREGKGVCALELPERLRDIGGLGGGNIHLIKRELPETQRPLQRRNRRENILSSYYSTLA